MKKLFFSFLLMATIAFIAPVANGQCSLCKATAETSLKEGNNSARGLNIGIFYLLVIPYAMIGGVGYWWYSKNRKQNNEESEVA